MEFLPTSFRLLINFTMYLAKTYNFSMIFGWRNSKWMRKQQRWRRSAVTPWCHPLLQYSTWCFVDVRVCLFKFIAFESVQFGVFMSICTIVRMHAQTLCFPRQFLHMNYNFVLFFFRYFLLVHWPLTLATTNSTIATLWFAKIVTCYFFFTHSISCRFWIAIYLFILGPSPNDTNIRSLYNLYVMLRNRISTKRFVFFLLFLLSLDDFTHSRSNTNNDSRLFSSQRRFPVSSFKCRYCLWLGIALAG